MHARLQSVRSSGVWSLLSQVSENVICKLQPIQMGVGIKGACELIDMATRHVLQSLEADSDIALLQVNFSNAFNSLRCQPMLDTVAA